MTALRNAIGHTIGYVDGGYHLLMTAVPASSTHPDTRLLRKDLYTPLATELLNNVANNFKALLCALPDREKCCPTIKKQSAVDISRFHILRRDATFIYSLIDEAVEKANSCQYLKVLILLNQFGQKDIEDIDIMDIFDPSDVCGVCPLRLQYVCQGKGHTPPFLTIRTARIGWLEGSIVYYAWYA